MTDPQPDRVTERREQTAEQTDRVGDAETESGPRLSVVVVTKDEADRVRDCIESVFAACRGVESFEVILVDSASTDDTVAYATDYPITVLRIPEEHTVSASTGRYVGETLARGDLLLHVDGDMELTETWLGRAVAYLESHDVAAVAGELDESRQTEVETVQTVNGVMLFDAEALAEVGGFDPHLHGYEDIEVSLRLGAAGHTLVRLPTVSAHHSEGEALVEPIRRWRHGYFFAPGQTIRKSQWRPRIAVTLIARQQYKMALVAWLALGAVSLYGSTLVLGWLVASLVGFGVIVSERGLRGGVAFVLAKLLGLAGLVVGLRKSPEPPESFPLDAVEVVEQGIVHESGVDAGGSEQ